MLKLFTAAIANNHVLEYLKAGVMRLPFFVARISTGKSKKLADIEPENGESGTNNSEISFGSKVAKLYLQWIIAEPK